MWLIDDINFERENLILFAVWETVAPNFVLLLSKKIEEKKQKKKEKELVIQG